jgi:hypothetical protein
MGIFGSHGAFVRDRLPPGTFGVDPRALVSNHLGMPASGIYAHSRT